MSSARTGALKLMGLMLVGGFMTGGLMAMTTPTQMKREAANWRQAIGVREVAASEPTIPIYAPPEDLTPVHWLPASDEYAYAPAPEPYVDTNSDLMPDAVDDTGPGAPEALPPQIMAARTSDPVSKDAATSADVAQVAVVDPSAVASTTSVAVTQDAPQMPDIAGNT